MPLSYNDLSMDMNHYMTSNPILNTIFGNIAITALILTILLILIDNINKDNFVSKIIYSYFTILMFLIGSGTLIKSYYENKNKNKLDEDFSAMMENNTNNANFIKKIGNNETNDINEDEDIVKFLNTSLDE